MCTKESHILEKYVLLNNVEACLIKTHDFFKQYSNLSNAHNTDFIIDNLWCKLIPEEIRNDLNKLTNSEISMLASGDINIEYKGLTDFIKEVRGHTLEAYSNMVITSKEKFEESLTANDVDNERLDVRNHHMSPKKLHEVTTMSSLCSRLARHHSIDQTLDIGSGRGYLGAHMALKYAMPVIGVDSKTGNTESAVKRSAKLAFQWKPKNNIEIVNKENNEKEVNGIDEAADLNQDLLTMEIIRSKEVLQSKKTKDMLESMIKTQKGGTKAKQILKERSRTPHLYTAKTLYVHPNLDLSHLIGNDHISKQMMITGLHTCGPLSPISLRLFANDEMRGRGEESAISSAKVLCNVGCCYHLLEEEFLIHNYDTGDAKSFPMSSVLIEKKYQLGRNARMLASQSVARLANTNQLPDKGIYWRAELQQILFEITNTRNSEWNIGKLSRKHNNFNDYVIAALAKLNITDNIIDNNYESKLNEERHRQINAFFQIRVILAPLVESLIILDRYHYLLSQTCIKEAYLIKLFDDIISPRCYAFIANK